MIKLINIVLIIICILGWLLTLAGLVFIIYYSMIGQTLLGIVFIPFCLFIGLRSFYWSCDLYSIFHKEKEVV